MFETGTAPQTAIPIGRSRSSLLRVLYVLFLVSGATSLVLETIFTRLLTYTFGNTAHAVSTVLAAFLGGLALGAYVLGRAGDRRRASLRFYAALEFAIGLYCLFVPTLFALTTRAYVGAYHHLHPGPATLVALHFALGAAPIIVPAFLMGGTLPVLARFVVAAGLGREPEINRLYGWNTLGAALGTFVSTYVLMPWLGVRATIWTACGCDFAIAVAALVLARHTEANESPAGELRPFAPKFLMPQHSRVLLHIVAFSTGAAALAYEVVWSHVQAFTIGSSVYAFGIMLFTVLCGLGLGAQLVARRLQNPQQWGRALAGSQVLLGAVVLVTVPLWGQLPYVFEHGRRALLLLGVCGLFLFQVVRRRLIAGPKTSGARPARRQPVAVVLLFGATVAAGLILQRYTTAFAASEMVRFLCGFYLLIVPALLLGMSFPLLLALCGGSQEEVGSGVGGVYAANTVGAIVGSVVTGFLILPWLGSQATLRALGCFDLLLGFGLALWLVPMTARKKATLVTASYALAASAWFALPQWDATQLLRGSYVYFGAAQKVERVLYSREDVQGGLTSVIESGPLRTLLSNAKFQGNNGSEMAAQSLFAMIPAIFTPHYGQALVIGLGTGNTLRVVSLFPFRSIDVAELAPHIVEASRLWFADVNGGVLDRDPRVKLTIADGRNFLLLSRNRYDLITVEITSIWISGEADLYNREFYELCRDHLEASGVLQQWVQLHHMRTQDLLTIFNTAAQVFPHLAFFVGSNQGVLLASNSPLAFDYAKTERLDNDAAIHSEEQRLNMPSAASLLGEIMLYGDSFQRALTFLPDGGGRNSAFISTDFRPYLEYATPKGNFVGYDAAEANLRFLRNLRPSPLPPDLPLLNVPSENERNLVLRYARERHW